MGNIDYTEIPLVKKFIELEASENKTNNIFLYAGGGYGKTTAIKCLLKYLLDKASNGEKLVPIYIDVKKLNFNEPNPVISYIHSKYSGSDTQESDVKNLFSDQAPEFSKKYTYYILIDGLNETNDANKDKLIDIISDMADISNVRFVVSSRIKETFDKAPFCTFELQKLNEEQIKDYLDKNFGKKYNEQTEVKRINKSLIEILQIPMFMKTFSKTYDKRSPYPDIYDEKTVRKADILDSYVQKILLNLKERTNSCDNNILEFVINFYLPALAFQMIKSNNSFNLTNTQFKDLRNNVNCFESLLVSDKYMGTFVENKYSIESICLDNFALLNKNCDDYSFVHQIWRDFFAAKRIINCMNAEKFDDLEISVDENIRQLVGELVREYIDEYKYSKKPVYKSTCENGRIKFIDDPDLRRCECDFEKKDNAKEPYSPIEHFMQQHNMNSANPISPIATRNLIEIMKTSRNNNITANYSYLNLCECQFRFSNLENSVFENVKFNDSTFLINQLFYNERIIKSYCSPKGTILFLISRNKIVVNKFNDVSEYLLKGLANEVDSLIFDDNDELVIYTIRNTIYIIDTKDYNTWQFSIKKPELSKLLISGDAKTIVGMDSEKCKEIYVGKNFDLKLPTDDVNNITFARYQLNSYIKSVDLSYDGKYVAISTKEIGLNIIYSDDFQIVNFDWFDCNYSSLAFSYDNKRIAVAYYNDILELYDFLSEKHYIKLDLSIQTKSKMKRIEFKNTNNIIIFSNDDEIISLNISDCIEKCLWERINISCDFVLIENNNLIFSDNRFIRFLDLNNMRIIDSIKHNCKRVLSISNDGMYFFSQNSEKKVLEICDLNTNIYCSLPIEDNCLLMDAIFSPVNKFSAYRYFQYREKNLEFELDKIISIVNNNNRLKQIDGKGVKSYMISNNGDFFAYINENGCLIIIDLNSFEEILNKDNEFIHITYFDSSLIILVNTNYELIMYDIELNELNKLTSVEEFNEYKYKLENEFEKEIFLKILEEFAHTLKISNDLTYSCFYANASIIANSKSMALNCSSNINGCIFENVNYIGSDAKSFFKSLYQYGAKLAKNELINAIEESE